MDADEFDQAFGSEIGSVENTLLVNIGGNYLLSDQDIDLLLYSDDNVGPDIDYNSDVYTTGDLVELEGDTDSNELLEDLLDNQLQKHFLPGSEGSFHDVFNNCDREQGIGVDHILALNNEETLLSIISSDWALLEDNKTLDPGSNSDSLYRDLIDVSMQQEQGIQALKRTRQQHLDHEALGNYSEKFMETRVQPREWVLQSLEEIASRFMEDLSLQVVPRIELASRELPKAIVYDEETGVIRRRQDLFPNQEHDTAEGSKRRKRGSFSKYGSTCAEREKTMGRTDAAPYTKTYNYGTRQTAQVNSILRAAQLVHENVYNGTVSTKRDLFYRDVATFGSQPAVDRIVEDLACTLQIPRPCLNVVAGARSVVYGSIRMTIRIQGKNKEVSKDPAWLQDELSKLSSFRAPTHPSSHSEERKRVDEDDPLDKKVSRTDYNTLVMVPATMDDILQIEIHSKTRFILVVEKEATMNHLISLGFSESHGPCILITSKGFPDRVARELLKILSDMIQAGVFTLSPTFSLDSCRAFPKPCLPLDIPMLALVDCDPHGISIFLTYRCGSVHSAYDNAKLAVPTLKCIGQVPQDWDIVFKYKQEIVCSTDRYFMQRLQDQLREALIPLTDRDRSMLIKMLTQHPFIRQHRAWTVEISKMLMLNRKSELQSLCLGGHSVRSVTLEESLEKNEKGNRTNNLGHAVELPSLVLYLERKLQEPRYWL
ncbi:endodeoxyribonuclease [Mortierella polycephala]|uniref:DNA topoisomerase (ATP-hydrolyzing) n=1 Tax=Mortierella polycephala TaxID=41804 RepID=A0A9P6TYY9_9FUNG|nr:endodeoxyribonuclease [Mortierella polycephala]